MSIFYSNQTLTEVKEQIDKQFIKDRLYNLCIKTLEEFFTGSHLKGKYHLLVSKTGCYIVNIEKIKKMKLKKLMKGITLITTFNYQGN